jgi:hypothetical protein
LSSLPELVFSFTSTLPEIFKDITDEELSISAVVIPLSSFLVDNRKNEEFKLRSYTLIRKQREETSTALGDSSLVLEDAEFWARHEREAWEQGDRTDEVHTDRLEPAVVEGLSSVDISLRDSNYRIRRDGLLHLSSRYATLEQVSTELLRLAPLIGKFIIPSPKP